MTKKYKIGFMDGTFDLFHVGHLSIIETAKSYCDYLIVAVQGDKLVQWRKNKAPIICEEDRRRILASVRSVDKAVIIQCREKRQLWDIYHFDVAFIGDDYKGTELWNRFEKELNEVGVDVVYIPYTQGISTTEIRKRVIADGLNVKKEKL